VHYSGKLALSRTSWSSTSPTTTSSCAWRYGGSCLAEQRTPRQIPLRPPRGTDKDVGLAREEADLSQVLEKKRASMQTKRFRHRMRSRLERQILVAPDGRSQRGARARPLIIERGEGCFISDIDGNRYLDCTAGLWNVNVGHRRPRSSRRSSNSSTRSNTTDVCQYANVPSIRLSKRLIDMLAPEKMRRVMFSSGGSDSTETAFKLAPSTGSSAVSREDQDVLAQARLPRRALRRMSAAATRCGAVL